MTIFNFLRNAENVSKAVTFAKAGAQNWLILLDSRSPIGVEDKLRGNDDNGYLPTFYEFVKFCA